MFTRANRLRRSEDILLTFRKGQRRTAGPLACYMLANPENRTTVIVDKKVSKLSVVRNRIKRLVRAALHAHGQPAGYLIVRAYAGAEKLEYAEVVKLLSQCLPKTPSSN